MSGHNKWSTIKHKKAATDAKKGKIFSRVAKEIFVAVRQGGSDPDTNISLRALMQKARSVNMPADNVDRAIKKASGDLGDMIMEELSYEGYASGGVAVVIQCLSDNKNRTAASIKHTFNKYGASLSAQGSVSRVFHRKGQITVPLSCIEEDDLMELVLDAGAEDMTVQEEDYEIITDPHAFMDVMDALQSKGIETGVSEITMIPETMVEVTERSKASSIIKFIDAIEDNEDVQNVYSNFDISEELMKELES